MAMTEAQLDQMGEAAFETFRMTGCPEATMRAAKRFARQEWNVTPSKNELFDAYNRAIICWEEVRFYQGDEA